MISNFEEILNSIPLDTIIGEHVELKNRGSNKIGKCPFHEEKTDSFSVNSAKGIYKCFGCGKGGNNAAQFLMDYKGLTFPEALEALAHRSNTRIEYEDGADAEKWRAEAKVKKEKRQAQEPVMQEAYAMYLAAQPEQQGDTIEIAGKTYTQATWKKWKLALRDKKNILTDSNLDKATLEELGLIKQNDTGKMYDFFYNRLLFPIHSPSGHIEGITARVLDDRKPKYLNSSDSELYNKSKSLFGIFYNMKNIYEKEFAYLMEGPTDVIILDQNGISNAVATCGTALTVEHAQVLKRYTSNVNIVRDNDAAGYNSILKDIEILTMAQIRCNVIFLPIKEEKIVYVKEEIEDIKQDLAKLEKLKKTATPKKIIVIDEEIEELKQNIDVLEATLARYAELPPKEDPASFISRGGPAAWKSYVDSPDNCKEGIKWRVSQEIRDKKNEHQKEVAIRVAARLLAYMDSDSLREQYIKSLSKEVIGCNEKILTEAYTEEYTKKTDKGPRLTPEQERDRDTYGIYSSRQNYINASGVHLSNFILKPIFLVRAGGKSYRVFDLFNEQQQSKCIVLDSDDLIQLNTFRKKTEMYGNYLFYGNESDYMKLRRLLYEKMPTVYQLNSLGFVKTTGIYAWGNGISTPEGEFLPVDEYGKVNYGDFAYYLQAFSKLNKDELQQEDDPNDFEKKFIYMKADITPHQWALNFYKLFGQNAVVGMSYYFSSIFRDHINNRFNCFPILNLFGPAGSGKSTMSTAIAAMFGKPINPIHCVNATKAAFLRRPAQVYNAVAVYEEYSDLVPDDRAQAIKSFFDGDGRAMAKKETSNKVESYPVNSGIILVGQMLPDHDPALIERCITAFFKEVIQNKEGSDNLKKFMKSAKEGRYSFITSMIHAKRSAIIEEFDATFEAVRDKIEKQVIGFDIKQRVLNSYSIILSMYLSVAGAMAIPVIGDVDSLITSFAAKVREQSEVNAKATELNEWWDIVDFLIQRGELTKMHYQVHESDMVTVLNKQKKSEQKALGAKKMILSFNLNFVFSLYVKECTARRANRVLKKNTLMYYLGIQKYLIGENNSMRINSHMGEAYNKTTRVWMFDLDGINDTQPLNIGITKGEHDKSFEL